MEHANAKDISEMEKIYRRNFIHSCSGYKSANLVATQSIKNNCTLAVFNSIFHLGSNPPLLGCVLRPSTVPKSTYHNILNTGFLTVNHIQQDMIKQAHKTTADYGSEISGFEQSGLDKEYLDDFPVPYVSQSNIKLGCKYVSEYQIKENNTKIIVAAIEHVYFEAGIQMPDGWLRLEDAGTLTLNGLDGYALPSLLDRFHYARPGQELQSFFKESNL